MFGPILLVVLARAGFRQLRGPSDPNKTLLLCFALPVLALLVVQALLSRAHGNWAATAYPAASVFVTAVLLEGGRQRLFNVSFGLHLILAAAIATAPAFARTWPMFEQLKFLRSSLGWEDTAGVVRERLAEERYGAILVGSREMAAELLYYLRDSQVPLVVWHPGGAPHDHYEMTRPFGASTREPILYVSLTPCPPRVTGAFANVTAFPAKRVPLVQNEARLVYTCRLTGFDDPDGSEPK
ncbi:hypothetical protein [Methyloceanibacter marginalis]|uniref:hypothetical protein n=1 Tax=Methyloceanibacter marginalis TaxID=1774971 RepID=UPI001FCCFF88|nr:hypothetical protein [Methyloceanibacter marginalis]